MYKIFFILFTIIFLTACATAKTYYEKAKMSDAIYAYEKFKRNWPNSKEYVELANERLKELYAERKEREEKRNRQERERRASLLEKTTIKLLRRRDERVRLNEFVKEWPLGETFLGKAGIIEIKSTKDKSVQVMIIGTNTKYDQSFARNVQSAFEAAVEETQPEDDILSTTVKYYIRDNERYKFCDVIFIKGMVDSVSCLAVPEVLKDVTRRSGAMFSIRLDTTFKPNN